MRPISTEGSVHLTLHVTTSTFRRLKQIRLAMASVDNGIPPLAVVLRAAVEVGVDALEKRAGKLPKAPPSAKVDEGRGRVASKPKGRPGRKPANAKKGKASEVGVATSFEASGTRDEVVQQIVDNFGSSALAAEPQDSHYTEPCESDRCLA